LRILSDWIGAPCAFGRKVDARLAAPIADAFKKVRRFIPKCVARFGQTLLNPSKKGIADFGSEGRRSASRHHLHQKRICIADRFTGSTAERSPMFAVGTQ
jgi:hypothetical protein